MNGRTRFLNAARREYVDTRPVWMMRQAGRFLPEYRAIREKTSFLELCANPELACEVTMQPIRRFDVDAAIIFSDILVPIAKMGQTLTFGKGHGPRLAPPIRSWDDFRMLRRIDPYEETREVHETVQRVRDAVGTEKAVIGFAGAPFTLLAYMVDGEGSRNFAETKRLLFSEPDLAHEILSLIADVIVDYLGMQIDAGADAVQLFDSWAGLLSPDDFDTFAGAYAASIMERLADRGTARIYFPKSIGAYLERAKAVPCEVVGVDWAQDLSKARELFAPDRALQGNLDPTALLGTREQLDTRIDTLLAATKGYAGHIVNLGHGIIPSTDPETALHFVRRVHELGAGCCDADEG
ncbi:MAG: uroporphyrinogen decarboxylase [Myxococcales bacterium]|nr:uroporphyrinogen decarboxylase [Myxococcales bacterium]